MEFEKDENFEIELFDPEGGAKIGKVNRTAVTITNDDGKCNCCLDVKYRYHLLRFIDTIFYLILYLCYIEIILTNFFLKYFRVQFRAKSNACIDKYKRRRHASS